MFSGEAQPSQRDAASRSRAADGLLFEPEAFLFIETLAQVVERFQLGGEEPRQRRVEVVGKLFELAGLVGNRFGQAIGTRFAGGRFGRSGRAGAGLISWASCLQVAGAGRTESSGDWRVDGRGGGYVGIGVVDLQAGLPGRRKGCRIEDGR